ncbi:hypothetical protein OAO18_03725 [Francisellaceae bacterium]|nr:hypothetical protein [Francisellaceae bacterium]
MKSLNIIHKSLLTVMLSTMAFSLANADYVTIKNSTNADLIAQQYGGNMCHNYSGFDYKYNVYILKAGHIGKMICNPSITSQGFGVKFDISESSGVDKQEIGFFTPHSGWSHVDGILSNKKEFSVYYGYSVYYDINNRVLNYKADKPSYFMNGTYRVGANPESGVDFSVKMAKYSDSYELNIGSSEAFS